jgi:hypothetical protein
LVKKLEDEVFETIYDTLAGNTQYPQFNTKNVEDIEIDYDKKRIYLLYREKESVPLSLKLEKPRCSELSAIQLRTLLVNRDIIRYDEAEDMGEQELEYACRANAVKVGVRPE